MSCVICGQGESISRLVRNAAMIEDVFDCCKERLQLGEVTYQSLYEGLNIPERGTLLYHSECRKPIVNKTNLKRLRSQSYSTQVRGRPTTKTNMERPNRLKCISKAIVCMFSLCNFCPGDNSGLHNVSSNSMGKYLIEIKSRTIDDNVRTTVVDLHDDGDAAALEKYYHHNCLRSASKSGDIS